MRSLISLRAGVYDASTDYSGRFTPDGSSTTHLGLSDDQVAFIGAASFETRKQLGPRTSLSLVTDYEYYSFVPQMKYADADVTPAISFAGGVNKTHISDDDAFRGAHHAQAQCGVRGPAAAHLQPAAEIAFCGSRASSALPSRPRDLRPCAE